MKCIKCGKDLFDRQLRCDHCGAIQIVEEKKEKKNPKKEEK